MSLQKSARWADLSVRAGSAIVLAPLVLAAIWMGGNWYYLLILLMGIMVAYEWSNIVHAGQAQQFFLMAAAVAAAVSPIEQKIFAIMILWAISILISVFLKTSNSVWSYIGIPYVALPVLAFSHLRADADWGIQAIVWCLVIVWAADILAYFAGRIIGGPKLVPKLSPKKTWAGLGGAITGAGLASILFSYVWNLNYLPLALLAALFAVLEQGGDIFESSLKRAYGVKDSGNLIPGHGGVLDRVDGLVSVVLAAFIVGYLHNSGSAAAGLVHW
jgi:phosphatidate cytidylyltransferase